MIQQHTGGPAISSLARLTRARSFVHVDGAVWVVCNHEDFAYYVDAAAGHSGTAMRQVIAQMRAWGLEPIEDEPTQFIGENMVRTYYTPITPLSDVEIAWLAGEEVVI